MFYRSLAEFNGGAFEALDTGRGVRGIEGECVECEVVACIGAAEGVEHGDGRHAPVVFSGLAGPGFFGGGVVVEELDGDGRVDWEEVGIPCYWENDQYFGLQK